MLIISLTEDKTAFRAVGRSRDGHRFTCFVWKHEGIWSAIKKAAEMSTKELKPLILSPN